MSTHDESETLLEARGASVDDDSRLRADEFGIPTTSAELPARRHKSPTGGEQRIADSPDAITRAALRRRLDEALKAMDLLVYRCDRTVPPASLLGLAPLPHPHGPGCEVTIDPPLAWRMLAHNWMNREISRAGIEGYARALLDGQWRTSSQAISFTVSGALANGQQRLLACVVTGLPVTALVSFGHADDSIYVEDKPVIRQLRHDLKIAGQTTGLNASQQAVDAAVVRIVNNLRKGRLPWLRQPKPSQWDASATRGEHPGIRPAIEAYYARSESANMPAGPTCAFLALLAEGAPALAPRFAEWLFEGVAGNDPAPDVVRSIRKMMGRRGRLNDLTRNMFMVRLARAMRVVAAGKDAKRTEGMLGDAKFPRVPGCRYDKDGRLLAAR